MPPSHSVFCNYLYFRDRATNFVEIWNIYANQMEIKVAISVINSDKLSHCYEICIWASFFETQGSNNVGVLASEGLWEAWQTSLKVTRSY